MITREEILHSPEYWFEAAQNELFRQLNSYMEKEQINQSQLAEKLSVTKGYISQILNGNFNYTLKKHIELALAIGVVPLITYQPIEEVLMQQVNPLTYSAHSNVATSTIQNTSAEGYRTIRMDSLLATMERVEVA
jgi:transcriptional regulator with XRE-family HTH domain